MKERHAHWDPAEYAEGDRCKAPWAPLQLHTWSLQDGRQCEHCKLLRIVPELDWPSLIFGTFSPSEVQDAVQDETWQELRVSLLGEPMDKKFIALRKYLHENEDIRRRIQITNYVYALRRGGLIK